MIIRHNFYQKSVFFNSSNKVTATFLNVFSSVRDYFHLSEINRQLAEENALLKSMHVSSFITDSRNTFYRNDTLYERRFAYLPAKVVNNTIHRPDNYLTLNKGSKDGVKPGMGVISPQGVVGIVKDVSPNFSTVYSVLHSQSKISGSVGSDEVIGTVVWPGKEYRRAVMNDISRHNTIHQGDTVLTSSFSQLFPGGVHIGYIESFSVNTAYDFYEINIILAVDFSKVSEVYLIISETNEEQTELENKSINE